MQIAKIGKDVAVVKGILPRVQTCVVLVMSMAAIAYLSTNFALGPSIERHAAN